MLGTRLDHHHHQNNNHHVDDDDHRSISHCDDNNYKSSLPLMSDNILRDTREWRGMATTAAVCYDEGSGKNNKDDDGYADEKFEWVLLVPPGHDGDGDEKRASSSPSCHYNKHHIKNHSTNHTSSLSGPVHPRPLSYSSSFHDERTSNNSNSNGSNNNKSSTKKSAHHHLLRHHFHQHHGEEGDRHIPSLTTAPLTSSECGGESHHQIDITNHNQKKIMTTKNPSPCARQKSSTEVNPLETQLTMTGRLRVINNPSEGL